MLQLLPWILPWIRIPALPVHSSSFFTHFSCNMKWDASSKFCMLRLLPQILPFWILPSWFIPLHFPPSSSKLTALLTWTVNKTFTQNWMTWVLTDRVLNIQNQPLQFFPPYKGYYPKHYLFLSFSDSVGCYTTPTHSVVYELMFQATWTAHSFISPCCSMV